MGGVGGVLLFFFLVLLLLLGVVEAALCMAFWRWDLGSGGGGGGGCVLWTFRVVPCLDSCPELKAKTSRCSVSELLHGTHGNSQYAKSG